MKWIKRLCSFIFLCILIVRGILLWQGYREYREALQDKSVEEMARQIESELDKDKILELYVNSIFFGNGYYCVGDACEAYFGQEPSEMDFDECTILAGLPNAPRNHHPVASPGLARPRQAQVGVQKREGGARQGT